MAVNVHPYMLDEPTSGQRPGARPWPDGSTMPVITGSPDVPGGPLRRPGLNPLLEGSYVNTGSRERRYGENPYGLQEDYTKYIVDSWNNPEFMSLISNIGAGMGAGGGNIDFDQFQPTTRGVTDEELVENQLTRLLASDSKYIQQARDQGRAAAQQRGGLNASIFAGASEAAAISAGFSVAQADAMAYRAAMSENMQAKNAHSLAKLQVAGQIESANIAASAQISSATIGARASLISSQIQRDTSLAVARLNADLQKSLAFMSMSHDEYMEGVRHEDRVDLATRGMSHEEVLERMRQMGRVDLTQMGMDHDQVMEQMRQEGRLEIADLNFNQQRMLQEAGFTHDINISELTQDQRIQLEEMFNDPRFYASIDANFALEQLRQDGRLELADLTFFQQQALMNAGFSHDIVMSELTHEQRLQVEDILGDRFLSQMSHNRDMALMNNLFGLVGMYADGITSLNFADIDQAAFVRGSTFFAELFNLGYSIIRWMEEGNGLPDIDTGGGP